MTRVRENYRSGLVVHEKRQMGEDGRVQHATFPISGIL